MFSRWFKGFFKHFSKSTKASDMVRVLNVAEKNDAAKSLAEIMSRGRYTKREGQSKFNKIYEFDYMLRNEQVKMSMTSVSGHLLNYEFIDQYQKWYSCPPVALFDAPVRKFCPQDYADIKKTLEREIMGCQTLIIWTDCDREGENIGHEVIQVCQSVKPNIKIFRAKFSEITPQAVARAIANLAQPDKRVSDAVDVRQQLDLRIGAAFTRFQTLRLQKVFSNVLADSLISYGSCQFPTLGFVVERYKQVLDFIAEPFYKIVVRHQVEDSQVEFHWKRVRLFDHLACLVLYQHCLENPLARVVSVKSKPRSRWRPQALDTVELEKLASRKLRINAKETMQIAEKLYTRGFISYPRTETNGFPQDLDLRGLIQMQTVDPNWGAFASRLMEQGPTPRNGTKSDKAHPPIHPTKYTDTLQGNEKRVYEYIVRHFLACCSQDAQGQETTVDIDINNEQFDASGLMVTARNFLDVYPYEKWDTKLIPTFTQGDTFEPKTIEMTEGETSPPSLLTEADLISLMDKHGIGTDATHAEHIETIKTRLYVGLRDDGKFLPGELGMGLVEGYDAMGFHMSKPNLRAELEADLQRICDGTRLPEDVLAEQLHKYKQVFLETIKQPDKIDSALAKYFGEASEIPNDAGAQLQQQVATVMPCSKCGLQMSLRAKKDGKGYYIGCLGYPTCKNAVWFYDCIHEAAVTTEQCTECQPGVYNKIHFKFKKGAVPAYIPLEYTGCVGACDDTLRSVLQLPSRPVTATATPAYSDAAIPVSQAPSRQRKPLTNQNGRNNNAAAPLPSTRPFSTVAPQMAPNRDVDRWPAGGPRGDNQWSAGGQQGDNEVQCNCGQNARQQIVRKEGPNTGRPFYVCAKVGDGRCTFFLWADQSNTADENGGGNTARPRSESWPRDGGASRYTSDSSRIQNTGSHQCGCGLAAKLLTTQKAGPNQGRQFYSCPKGRSEGCNFFQWADEAPGDAGSSGGGFQLQQQKRRSADSNADGGASGSAPKRKRRCGACGEEGHTKNKCQNR